MIRRLPFLACLVLGIAGPAAADELELECPEPPDDVRLREIDAEADADRLRVDLSLEDPHGVVAAVRVMAWDEAGHRTDGNDSFVVKKAFLTTSDLYRANIPADELGGARKVRWYAAAVDADKRVVVCLGSETAPKKLRVKGGTKLAGAQLPEEARRFTRR